YNVCQHGTKITSDCGILRNFGYPTQFKITTLECHRTIHVPNDKTICLWLSDLYIDSTHSNCAKENVSVVDSNQTYPHYGLERYAYSYLCLSTIIIQYFIIKKL
ncbi:unnamed protein product, partial [Didymodactylos carnosus]